jgi:hypothetical protein
VYVIQTLQKHPESSVSVLWKNGLNSLYQSIIEYDSTIIRNSFDIAKFLDAKFPERRIVGEERNCRSIFEDLLFPRGLANEGSYGSWNIGSQGPTVLPADKESPRT